MFFSTSVLHLLCVCTYACTYIHIYTVRDTYIYTYILTRMYFSASALYLLSGSVAKDTHETCIICMHVGLYMYTYGSFLLQCGERNLEEALPRFVKIHSCMHTYMCAYTHPYLHTHIHANIICAYTNKCTNICMQQATAENPSK